MEWDDRNKKKLSEIFKHINATDRFQMLNLSLSPCFLSNKIHTYSHSMIEYYWKKNCTKILRSCNGKEISEDHSLSCIKMSHFRSFTGSPQIVS
jgi:hypothetical protein